MQVRYGLAGVRAAIGHNTVAAFSDTLLSGQLADDAKQMPDQRGVFVGDVVHRSDFLLGNDQKMHRCLGHDVVKREAKVVFVQYVRRNLPVDDFFEYGCHGSGQWLVGSEGQAVIGNTDHCLLPTVH